MLRVHPSEAEGFEKHTESWYKPFGLLFFNEKYGSLEEAIKSAVALDANGYPKADAKPVIKGNTLTLPANALYTIVTR